jgi:hypothetical protein
VPVRGVREPAEVAASLAVTQRQAPIVEDLALPAGPGGPGRRRTEVGRSAALRHVLALDDPLPAGQRPRNQAAQLRRAVLLRRRTVRMTSVKATTVLRVRREAIVLAGRRPAIVLADRVLPGPAVRKAARVPTVHSRIVHSRKGAGRVPTAARGPRGRRAVSGRIGPAVMRVQIVRHDLIGPPAVAPGRGRQPSAGMSAATSRDPSRRRDSRRCRRTPT